MEFCECERFNEKVSSAIKRHRATKRQTNAHINIARGARAFSYSAALIGFFLFRSFTRAFFNESMMLKVAVCEAVCVCVMMHAFATRGDGAQRI